MPTNKHQLQPTDLEGTPRRFEIAAPVADEVALPTFAQYDDYCKARGYPEGLMRYDKSVHALLNYGHRVFFMPERTALEEQLEILKDVFGGDVPEKESALQKQVRLVGHALIATIQYQRGG